MSPSPNKAHVDVSISGINDHLSVGRLAYERVANVECLSESIPDVSRWYQNTFLGFDWNAFNYSKAWLLGGNNTISQCSNPPRLIEIENTSCSQILFCYNTRGW